MEWKGEERPRPRRLQLKSFPNPISACRSGFMPDKNTPAPDIKPDLQMISAYHERHTPLHFHSHFLLGYADTFFSVRGIMTPRRKRVTCPELEETTSAMQSATTEMAAAAACRAPSPLGRTWL
jgi:hypothetical protein